jgi:hypothetical protein
MSRPQQAGVALLLVMLTVWAIRSLAIGDDESATPSPATANVAADSAVVEKRDAVVVATADVEGVPVGYPPSEAGATTAAVNWVASFSTLVRMGPLRLSDSLQRLMTESGAAAGVDEAVADYLTFLDEFGGDFDERIWIEAPMRTATTEFTADAAEVSVWAALITGDSETGPVEVLWRTHRISLRWESNDWRVEAVAVQEGPTPIPVEAALPSPPSDFESVDSWTPAVFADTTVGES